MKLRPYAWAGLALVVTLAGFVAGRALHPDAPPAFVYDVEASPYTTAPVIAALSRGGFSGFGTALGIEGETVQAGRVTAVTPTGLTLASPDGVTSTIRIAGAPRILRIEPGSVTSLRPGATVVARLASDGETVEALLVVSEP